MTALQRRALPSAAVDGVRAALAAARTIDELLATAAEQARAFGGFGRALVLDVAEGHLRADITGELAHEASDELRRRVLADPIPLGDRSLEADLVRGAPAGRNAPSTAEARLGLDAPAFVAIVPQDVPVALLVADRPTGRPGGDALTVIAHLTALTLTALVLRTRIDELSTEIRYLTTSAHALLHEAQNARISLPRDHGQGLAFVHVGVVDRRRGEDGLLTLREREIMDRVVEGRSNAEIAADLHLAVDTVKTHIRRLLRKLGATNRVGAAVAYLEREREAAA